MLFNLDFAKNTIFHASFFFLSIDLFFLIPVGVPIKEAKAEICMHSVVVEVKIRMCSI